MLYYSDQDVQKNLNDYCNKRKELEYLVSEEYISKNINWLDVKCPQVDSAVFDCPINNENINAKYQLSSRTKSAIFTSLLIASMMFFVLQTIWNSVELFANEGNLLVILAGLIMDCIFLLSQALSGVNTAFTIIDQQEVLPYVNRNRILEKYLYYKNDSQVEEVKKYLIEMRKECQIN